METINATIRRPGTQNVSYTFESGVTLKSVIETAQIQYKPNSQSLSVNGNITTDLSTRLTGETDILLTPQVTPA